MQHRINNWHKDYRNRMVRLLDRHGILLPKGPNSMKTNEIEYALTEHGIRLPLEERTVHPRTRPEDEVERLIDQRIHIDRLMKDNHLALLDIIKRLEAIRRDCEHLDLEDDGVMIRCMKCRLDWLEYGKKPRSIKRKIRKRNDEYRPIVTVKAAIDGLPTYVEFGGHEYVLRK